MYKKSIGLRLIAYIIDFLLLYILGGILHVIFGLGTLRSTSTSFNFSLNWFELFIVAFIYFMLFAILTNGKTIGKLITKVEIRNNNLELVERKTIILREFIKSLFILFSIISFIVVLVREDRKSLHDLVVDTIVIRKVKRNEFIEDRQTSNN